MTAAALPTPPDLQPDEAGDAFLVEVCVDHDAGENSGLVEAMAELLIDLYHKRRRRVADEEVEGCQ